MNGEEKKIIINHRMAKAKNTLHEVSQLLKFGFYNNAVLRIYYACFYCVTALLLKKDVKTKSHKGVRQMLGLHFIETGKMTRNEGAFFSDLLTKDLRVIMKILPSLKKKLLKNSMLMQ